VNTKSGFVSIDHANIYYEVAGTGRPIVFIHAGVADSRQWNNEFVRFAPDFRVLRYDLRGYGKSAPAEGEFSNIEDLTALLDQLDFRQPLVFIGCSLGGGLAMDFTLANPSRVRALVMVGSGPSGLALDVPGHPQQAAAEEAYKAGNLDLVAELETQIWFDGMGRTPQQVDQQVRALALEMNRLALSHDARQLGKQLPDAETPATEQLDQLAIPVLVLIGEHDLPYLHAAADYMKDNIPSARKVLLPNAAHLPNMERPALFQSVVFSFLNEIPE